MVRFPLADRDNSTAIRKIMLPTPDGNLVPLGEIADVDVGDGAFAIYREGGRRYVHQIQRSRPRSQSANPRSAGPAGRSGEAAAGI